MIIKKTPKRIKFNTVIRYEGDILPLWVIFGRMII